MTWETMLRPRSSGARVRAWFCIRGRSLGERAMIRSLAEPDCGAGAAVGYHGESGVPQVDSRATQSEPTTSRGADHICSEGEGSLFLFFFFWLLLGRG